MLSAARKVVRAAPGALDRPPDRKGLLAVVHDHEDELVHVEGPAVITGKIVQARRIGGAERLHPGLGHRRLHAAEAGKYLLFGKALIGGPIRRAPGSSRETSRLRGYATGIGEAADRRLVPTLLRLHPALGHGVDGDVSGTDPPPSLDLLVEFLGCAVDDGERCLDPDPVRVTAVGDGDLAHPLDALPAEIVRLEIGQPSVAELRRPPDRGVGDAPDQTGIGRCTGSGLMPPSSMR